MDASRDRPAATAPKMIRAGSLRPIAERSRPEVASFRPGPPQLEGGSCRVTEESAGIGDCALGNRAWIARLGRAGEFNAFRPMIVRCQALRPGRSSTHLHSTQPRTWQARFVDFRTAAVCALSRGPRSRSVSRSLRWSSDGHSHGLRRYAYPTIAPPPPGPGTRT